MKVKCRYSGISFTVSSFPQVYLAYSSAHPIMFCPTEVLLAQTENWANADLTNDEERLLFCALLKSTDLVDFRVPANPTPSIVKRNMDRLILTVGWRNSLGDQAFPVPKFAIDKPTADLESISGWLDAWNDAKKDWETKGISWSLQQKLALREEALMKMIRSPSRKEDSYARKMAQYVMEVTQAPAHTVPYWIELFCLKDNEAIWKVPSVDLDELIEHMETTLNPTTLIAHDAFSRIRRIIEINKKGIYGGLGIDDDAFSSIYSHTGSGPLPKFSIVNTGLDSRYSMPASFSSVEDHNLQVAISRAPVNEPVQSDYPSRVSYLIAVSAWRLAQSAKQKLSEKKKTEVATEVEDKETWDDLNNLDHGIQEEFNDLAIKGLGKND
jgi:hypothetical protein